jgi:hypothetical protein
VSRAPGTYGSGATVLVTCRLTTGVNVTVAGAGGFSPDTCTSSVVFGYVPGVSDVTWTVTVHELIPSDRFPCAVMVRDPAGALTAPAGQVVDGPGPVARRPAGRVSVKDQPFLAARSVVLVIVNVSVETPPCGSVSGLNDLSRAGVTSRMRMSSNAVSFPVPLPCPFTSWMPTAPPLNSTDPLEWNTAAQTDNLGTVPNAGTLTAPPVHGSIGELNAANRDNSLVR